MPPSKTININPSLLKVGTNNNSTRKKQSKQKPDISRVKPNTLKRNLLKRLKQHSSRDHKQSNKPKIEPSFSTEFEKGIEYLNKLKTTKKNKTLKKKQTPTLQSGSFVSLDLPVELKEVSNNLPRPTTPAAENMNPVAPVVSPPPYGNLKGGSKPTFREWKNKTQRADPKIEKEFDTAEKINRIKSRLKEEKELTTSDIKIEEQLPAKKNKHNKTVKTTLGKNKNKVSILIKDNKTRKKVQFEQSKLHSKPISEVKDYLRKKYLLKVGSKAPPEVLRRMYEDAHLTGDVTNLNTETLLHNYVNEST